MAFQLAEAYTEFTARGATSVMGQVEGIGQKLTSMKAVAAGALATLGGFVGVASASGLLKLAADAEATAVSLEVMLGSAEAADKIIRQLRAHADVTPFGSMELIEAAKTLSNYGVATDNLVPVIDRLSNVAAGSSDKLATLANVFGQVAANGRLTGGDLMQFINVGFNPLQVIAEKTGESMVSLRDRMSKGQIGIEQLAQAIEWATSEGGQFYQMNEKQSQTLAGLWTTLTGTIVGRLREVGEAMVESLDLKGVLDRAIPMVMELRDRLLPSITAGLEYVREKITELAPTFLKIAAAVGTVANLVLNVVPPIVAAIIDWVVANHELLLGIGLVVGAMIGLPALFSAVAAGAGILAGAIAGLMSPIGLVIAGVGVLSYVFPEFFQGVIGWLMDVIQHWEVAWPLMIESAKLQISNLWERIKTFGINVVEIVQWFGENWYNILRDYVTAQLTVVTNLYENIKSGWQAVKDFFSTGQWDFNWTPLLEGFKATVEQLPELTRANVQASNAEIDRLAAEFERRRSMRHVNQQASDEADATSGGPGEMSFGGAPPQAGDTSQTQRKGPEFVGLAQLAERMQAESAKAADEKRREQLAERQAAASEKLAQQAEGDGLKVQLVSGHPYGAFDPAFG